MDTIEARTKALEFNAELLEWAWESTTLEDLMEKYETDEGGAMAVMFALGTATVEMHWDVFDFDGDGECECVDVGDEDPTLEYADDEACCLAVFPPYSCTRLEGHTGMHIAGDGLEVVAVWE